MPLSTRASPDSDGDGEIDVKELDSTIRLYKRRKRAGNLGTWHGNLSAQQDPVFPNWLIGRDDFQQVFTRQEGQGIYSGSLRRSDLLSPITPDARYFTICLLVVRVRLPWIERAR